FFRDKLNANCLFADSNKCLGFNPEKQKSRKKNSTKKKKRKKRKRKKKETKEKKNKVETKEATDV
ncbi:hypothetical protein, partial [Sphingobacterium daejeonense]|uniref:hypothetical protein n=1 Tax=Sphingobacterium daejeonense TaxID=371142 RepID=UPI003D3166E1